MRRLLLRTNCAALLAGAAFYAIPSLAQEGPPIPSGASSDAAAEPAAPTNEDIVVTARRRSERLQDVPVAVTAFDQKFLDRQSTSRISELAAFTPGLVIAEQSNGSGGQIYLRGVGSSSTHPMIEQAVALNVDSVQVGSGLILRAGQIDIQQVEVLRGPQALFFGKNSPGGVISITTADPGRSFDARLRTGYEFIANEHYVEGMVSGPLTDSLGARVVARVSGMDGLMKVRSVVATTPIGNALGATHDRFPGSSDIVVRGTLKFDRGSFLARAKLTYSQSDVNAGVGVGQQRVFCALGVPQFGGAAIPAVLRLDDCKPDGVAVAGDMSPASLARDPLLGTDPDGFRNTKLWLGSLELGADLGNGLRLTSVSAYLNAEAAESTSFSTMPVAAVIAATDTLVSQVAQEVRITSDWDGLIDLSAGVYYERSNKEASSAGVAVGNFLGHETFKVKSDTYSMYGQVDLNFTEQLRLSGGARYTREERNLRLFVNRTELGNIAERRISFDNVSPETTLSYRPSRDHMLFLSYKTGYKSGGYDAAYQTGNRVRLNPAARITYEPESAKGFEGGVKNTLLDGALTLNLTGYFYKYKNLQLSSYDPNAFVNRTVNAAAVTIKGLEGDFSWRPKSLDGLTVRGSLAYNHANYDRFISGCYAGQTIELGCNLNASPTGAFTNQDLTGTRLAFAPRLTGTFGVYYEADLGGLKLGLSSDSSYSSSYVSIIEAHPGGVQSRFLKTDLSLRLFAPDQRWEVALVGRNLTDKYNVTRASGAPATGTRTGLSGPGVLSDLFGQVTRGREVLVQVTFRPFGG